MKLIFCCRCIAVFLFIYEEIRKKHLLSCRQKSKKKWCTKKKKLHTHPGEGSAPSLREALTCQMGTTVLKYSKCLDGLSH